MGFVRFLAILCCFTSALPLTVCIPVFAVLCLQTLYSFDGDYRAFKAEIAAAYNGIALTRKTVDVAAGEHQSPAFAAKSPLGKVPVLETESGT